MKNLALLISTLVVFTSLGCEKKMKEHPLPESLKQKLIKQNDPALKAKEISGTVTVDKAHASSIPKNAKLFIFARPEGVEGGPPLAVKRHSLVEFPFQYTIGPADVMLEGNSFEGRVTLTARLDQDGNAKASSGDIEGTLTVEAGSKNVDLVLNKKIEIAVADNSVTGTLRLDPELAKNLPDTWKLFLIARPAGVERGMPLAVILLDSIAFPYPFRIGQENVMMPGTTFEGDVTLTARIDQDGDARAGPGDIEGMLSVQAGDKDVELTLNRLVGG